MTTATAEPRNGTAATQETALAPQGRASGLVVCDEGEFANLLDSKRFEHMWRIASLFSKSALVPEHFRNQPENCFIATQMAVRLGVDPFMMLQNTYIVHGRPGMEAKLVIALINSSGLFTDSLDYEVSGEDPNGDTYRVRAFATRKTTGKVVYGPWIDWKLVEGEGWLGKTGSKWKTMPGMMFMYRAAAFFGRLHCPERLMGMQTADELDDVGSKHVENTAPGGAASLTRKLEEAASRVEVISVVTGEVTPTPKVEPVAPVATEEKPKPADNAPSRPEQLTILLAEKCGVEVSVAATKLAKHVKAVYSGKALADLPSDRLDHIENQIKSGDIKA